MIEIIKKNHRHFSDFGWLKTYWLFSFSNYYDPHNIQFGPLRVFNDDVVEPGTGFPTHPHEEMEIITIVLEGEITHEDSMGNKTVIRTGDVQRMSAGTGLTHSEFNLAKGPVHFYQIWILPDKAGQNPEYDQKTFNPSDWRNELFPVASGQNIPGTVSFHADATIYRCRLEKGNEIFLKKTSNRRVFIYLTHGNIQINDPSLSLSSNDQARIDVECPLILKASELSDFIFIDLPSCIGWGYSPEILAGKRK